jgi:hypothetical protein
MKAHAFEKFRSRKAFFYWICILTIHNVLDEIYEYKVGKNSSHHYLLAKIIRNNHKHFVLQLPRPAGLRAKCQNNKSLDPKDF